MIAISADDKPKWASNIDDKKVEYISKIVHQYLFPKYSSNDQWRRFYEYLSAHDAFVRSQHYYRYLNTFGSIATQLGEISDKTIVETGGASPISTFLAAKNKCFATESDLRMKFDVDSEFADIVISLEVIEHIKDAPEKDISDIVLFRETGVRSFASEINRIVKSDGDVVLTTPNVCSYKAIANAIEHKAPCIFRPHVREYTKEELLKLFSKLDVQYYSTMFNFFMLGDACAHWSDIFTKMGWSVEDRGDDHFFYFRKPNAKQG